MKLFFLRHTSLNINPDIFYALSSEDVENKCLAMNDYYTECKPWPYPRSSEGIETLAKFRGMQSGNSFAEAFKIIRTVQ